MKYPDGAVHAAHRQYYGMSVVFKAEDSRTMAQRGGLRGSLFQHPSGSCASRIVNQAAMGSWTSPWLCDCQVMRDMSAHRVVDFPPASIGVLPSSEA